MESAGHGAKKSKDVLTRHRVNARNGHWKTELVHLVLGVSSYMGTSRHAHLSRVDNRDEEKDEEVEENVAPRGGEVASTAGMNSKPIVGQESGEQNVEEDSRDEDDDDDDEEQQKDEGGNEAGKHKRVAVDTPSAATWKVQVGSACECDVDEMAEFPPSPSPQE